MLAWMMGHEAALSPPPSGCRESLSRGLWLGGGASLSLWGPLQPVLLPPLYSQQPSPCAEQSQSSEGAGEARRAGLAWVGDGMALPTDGSCSPLPGLPGPSFRTFVLSWVINVEVPVPHDCQLHRQVVDLHPFVGILQPGPEGKEKAGSQRFLGGAQCSAWCPQECTGSKAAQDCAGVCV